MKKLILFASVFALLTACGSSDEQKTEDALNITSFKDPRTGIEYPVYKDDRGRNWLATDVNFPDVAQVNSSDEAGAFTMFTWAAAQTVCPEGWRLPTRSDWKLLLDQYPDGVDEASDNTAEAFVGLTQTVQFGFQPRGMYVQLPGDSLPAAKGAGEYAYYWTSTETEDGKAFALRLDYNKSITYLQAYDKRGISSCRCIQSTANIEETQTAPEETVDQTAPASQQQPNVQQAPATQQAPGTQQAPATLQQTPVTSQSN
jgi:uncharacterized protein (TIGR02145 family)